MSKGKTILGLAVAVLLATVWAGLAVSQEGERGRRREAAGGERRPQRDQARRGREARGQGQRAPRGGAAGQQNPGQGGRMRQRARFAGMGRQERGFLEIFVPLNPIDQAHYAVAELLLQSKRDPEAIRELRKVIAKSPDKPAVAATHLNLGRIYRDRIGDTAKALAEYKKVQGDLSKRALQEIVTLYVEMEDPAKAAEEMEAQLAKAKTPEEKVRLLNLIAEFHVRTDALDKAMATYGRIVNAISYEEAEKLKPAPEEKPQSALGTEVRDWFYVRIRDLSRQGRREDARALQQRLLLRMSQLREPPPEERERGVIDFYQSVYKPANVHYLGRASWTRGFYIATVDRVDTLEDLRGLKMPVSPAQAPAFKALGIVGVDIDDGEVYTALDRGILGGVAEPVTLTSFMGWGEALNYLIDHPFYDPHLAMLMNLDTWNRLSGKQQKFLTDIWIAIEKEVQPHHEAVITKHYQGLVDAGLEVIKFPPALEKQFYDLVNTAGWADVKPKLSPESYAKLRELLIK